MKSILRPLRPVLLLGLALIWPAALHAQQRLQAVTPFVGSGLVAAGFSNNWTVAGPLGGLAGAPVSTTAFTVPAGAASVTFTVTFAQHGTASTNALFYLASSADGTNYGNGGGMIGLFVGGADSPSGVGATNGFCFSTNVLTSAFGNNRYLRPERITNGVAISNLVIRAKFAD